MQSPTWRKPSHKRKYWKQQPIHLKILHYMKFFANDIFHLWMRSLPFPTLLKVSCSFVLLFLLLIPLLYPMTIITCSYLELQISLKRHFNINFPVHWDLLSYAVQICDLQKSCAHYGQFLKAYFERLRILAFTMISIADYLRIIFFIYIGA